MSVRLDGAASQAQPAGAADYAPRDGVYDLMRDADGGLRPAWRDVAQWFDARRPDVLDAQARRADRLMQDCFSEPVSGAAPWRLDIAPLALSLQDWSVLEQTMVQRIRLYDALLADLYGPQTLLADGVIPPEVALRDPRFLRPLHGSHSETRGLTLLALDVARGPDGAWRVLDAHAETTAGLGYVIANRMAMADIADDLFRSSNALRIGGFFMRLSEILGARAQGEDPMIALLAGQPTAPGFAGHAYLARYLGYQRVEGLDLRVVDGRLYLKSIDGLRRIDVMLRGVEGRRCDPLELALDGFDGPAGLAQAVRTTPDLLANPLGASVIENRGLSPFLSAAAGRLLGEDLLMADAPRLWLGEPSVREAVLADLDGHVLYDAFEGAGRPGQARQGMRAAQMEDSAVAALRDRAMLDGAALVAERPIGLATTPSWTRQGLEPGRFALRLFALSDGETQTVMPGGLALTLPDSAAVGLSAQAPYAHDVWVMGAAPTAPSASLRRMAAAAAPVHRAPREVQSRVADDLFWLGRYCARADATLRLLRQSLTHSTSDLAAPRHGARPLRALTHLLEKDDAGGASRDWTLDRAICAVFSDPQPGYGLATTLGLLRGVAARNRDRLSADSWRVLNGLTSDILDCGCSTDDDAAPALGNTLAILEGCEARLRDLAAFSGMTYENLTRDRGWRFLDLGRRLEHAINLAELLQLQFAVAAEADVERDDLDFILSVADSTITYRSRYRFAPELPLVLDLVMIEEINPRSLAHQLARISEHIDELPKAADDAVRSPDQRLALDLLTRVRLADLEMLTTPDAAGARAGLCGLLTDLASELPRLSEMISRQYFSLADEAPQRLGQF